MTTERRWAERVARGGQGTRRRGFVARAPATCAEQRVPGMVSVLFPMPPTRWCVEGVCAGSAARPGAMRPRQRTQRWTRHAYPGLNPGALLHTGRQAAMGLQERDKLAFRLRIALDVALRHGQAGMPREFLDVPETAPDLGDSARGPRNEGAASRVRRTPIHLQRLSLSRLNHRLPRGRRTRHEGGHSRGPAPDRGRPPS
jgi:hypothetical protein